MKDDLKLNVDSLEHAINQQDIADIVNRVERLPEKERNIVFQELEIYSGDLPQPKVLEGYNKLYPNAAKRIIENGIIESEHRRKLEELFLDKQFRERQFGQILGFVLALVSLGVGGLLIFTGNHIVGSIFSGVTTIGLIGLFTGSESKEKQQ